MEFEIEKHHEMPQKTRYPFPEMEIGDSFFFKGKNQATVATSARIWARSRDDGRKFSTRQVDGGYRIWRIK